jgi:FkbM family methyltransferase
MEGNPVPSFKHYAQSTLKKIGLYERARASSLYELYWTVADKDIISARQKEEEFYRSILRGFRPGDLIFDIGANHGAKATIFMSLGARVVAVEPDEANQKILNEMFLKYRLTPKPVVIVGKAVSDSNGVETMWIDEPGSAKNTFSSKWVETLREDKERFGETLSFREHKDVETTTLEQLVATYGVPFFVKIDVEGHELKVLRGMRRPVPYLSFEVNLPEFREEGLECVAVLERLAPESLFNYTADCQLGLGLKDWLPAREFVDVLGGCADLSIEVIWNGTGTVRANGQGQTARI